MAVFLWTVHIWFSWFRSHLALTQLMSRFPSIFDKACESRKYANNKKATRRTPSNHQSTFSKMTCFIHVFCVGKTSSSSPFLVSSFADGVDRGEGCREVCFDLGTSSSYGKLAGSALDVEEEGGKVVRFTSLITKGSFRRATLSFILRSKCLGWKAPKIDISILPPPPPPPLPPL